MANRLSQILSRWEPLKQQQEWVLGSVIATAGPSYRKSGAMMMINGLGQCLGLLSGGCLEADITLHARKVLLSNQSKRLIYDALDEDSAWLLGIGCGGSVEILLQPVNQHNGYLQLDKLLLRLNRNQHSYYHLDTCNLDNPINTVTNHPINSDCLTIQVSPDPNLAIFGGGVDAIPLINIANQMGWKTHLVDHRVTHARAHQFQNATSIHHQQPKQIFQLPKSNLDSNHWLNQCDAAVVMTHNLSQDAEALNLLSSLTNSRLNYIGLLGPESRKQKVLLMANLSEALLPTLLHGPMGLDIGGELPESIALSIMSEIHAVLEGKSRKLVDTISQIQESSQ